MRQARIRRRRPRIRQADQAPDDFAVILDELDFVKARLARMADRAPLSRMLLARLRQRLGADRGSRVDTDPVGVTAADWPRSVTKMGFRAAPKATPSTGLFQQIGTGLE
jgi:hypothetical protein